MNGRRLDPNNPEITVSPGQSISGYLRVTVDNNRGGAWITPVIGTASFTRRQSQCIAGDAPSGGSTQTYSFSLTAPSQPGTHYIGVFTGWMYSCDEVASNDHPPNYGDGDDVWDMLSQGWEEVIANGQASTGPYRMPRRAIRIVVQQQQFTVRIVSYNAPSTATVAERVSIPITVEYSFPQTATAYVGLSVGVQNPDGSWTRVWYNPEYETPRTGSGRLSYTAVFNAHSQPRTYNYRIGAMYWYQGLSDWVISDTKTFQIVVQQPQDTVAPSVRVIAPNGGETLTVGGTFRIRWEASDNVGLHHIHILLFHDGSQIQVIARDLQNTGYYDWTVPDRPGINYRVRVVAVDAAGNSGHDDSDAPFSIVRQQQPTAAKVQIGIIHTYVGDLRIWLGVQGGREVLIWNREGGSSDNIFREWDLFSLGFTENDLPPSSSKRWYLKVRDEASGDEGRIEYFRIVYQGQTYESQDRPEIKDYQEVMAFIPSRQQLDNAQIVDFSPPSGVFETGSLLIARIKVKNAGMTTRSFWVGLSYRKPDGSYYDITPQQTNTLSPGQEQTLTFQWQLPKDAPTGEYDAITAVWNGYDPQRNIMIEPQYDRREVPNAFEVVEEELILFSETIYYRRLIPTGVTSEVRLEPIGYVYLTGRRNLIVGHEYLYKLKLAVGRGPETGREYFIHGASPEKPGIMTFFVPEELDWRFDPTKDFTYPRIRWQSTVLDWLRRYIGWAVRAIITLIAGAFGGPIGSVAAGFVMFIIGHIFQSEDRAYDLNLGSTITPANQDPAKADAVIINWSEQGNTQGPIVAILHVIPSEYARGKEFQISIAIDFWVGGGEDQNILVRGNSKEITVRE